MPPRPRPTAALPLLLAIAVALPLTGCLPFGNKSEPSELFPADSVSRQMAGEISVRPLALKFRVEPDDPAFFGSIRTGPDSLLWVGDLSSGSIRRFGLDGAEDTEMAPIRSEHLQYPYLVGSSGDAVFVFDAGTEVIAAVDQRGVHPRATLPARAGGMRLSRFVTVLDGLAYVRDAGSHESATIAVSSLDDAGGQTVRTQLDGPAWRHHGILKVWDGRVVGASSYQPILYFFEFFDGSIGPDSLQQMQVDSLRPLQVDSLRLRGFDSPMLARSRAFALGEVDEPPLMISSFDGVGDRLFVINVRPGILRIDEFDVNGMLQAVYQREAPEPESFTPVDIVVTTDEAGSPAFFVISTSADYAALSLDYRSRLDRLEPS